MEGYSTSSKKISAKTAVKASAMIEALDKLAVERNEFEQTDLARTNMKLYKLLAMVYARYEEAAAQESVLKLTVAALTERMKAAGKRVQQNTPALSLFVRFVVDSERQRIFTYTRAIQAAQSNSIKPDGFAQFVIDEGGLEDCKAKVKPSAKAQEKQQQIADAMPLVEEILDEDSGNVLAEFKVDAAMVEELKDGGKAFMIGTCDAMGNVQVRSVIPAYSDGFEKWAKTKMAEYLHEQQGKSTKKEAEDEQEMAIEQAMSMLTKAKSGTVKVGELA